MCVLMKCVATVQLCTGLLLCVCYSNALLQYSWVEGYCYVCVTVMYSYITVGWRATVMCVLL